MADKSNENSSDFNINKKCDNKKDKEKSKSMENTSVIINGDSSKLVVNGEKDRELTPSEDSDDKKRDAEVVFIQDLGFTVKIVSPGAEPLDIQVTIILLITGVKNSSLLYRLEEVLAMRQEALRLRFALKS